MLKDGADSVAALGALNRVYFNIGLFSEEWLLHFNALLGGRRTTAIEISVARQNSSYWEAPETQTVDMVLFFSQEAPHKLKDAPGGDAYRPKDKAKLTRGKLFLRSVVRAAIRARARHQRRVSIPEAAPAELPRLLEPLLKLDEDQRVQEGDAGDRAEGRLPRWELLSTELRVPVTRLETNVCSPLATNAMADNIWDNFSSKTYKDLRSAGTITVYHPVTGAPAPYEGWPAAGATHARPRSSACGQRRPFC